MKNKVKHYLKEIIKFVIILTIVLNVISYVQALNLNKGNLELQDFKLLDGSEYKLKESSKPVLIHFWATWCHTCKIEVGNIQRVAKNYEVLTIAVQSGEKEEIEEYMKDSGVDFKVVNDEEGYYAQKFNIKAYPTSLIYDKNKELKFSEVGYTSTLGLYLRMWLSQIL